MGKAKVSTGDAEASAIAALQYLASDPERLGRFLSLTGLGPDTLRRAASEDGFLLRVLDHLLEDEKLLVAFAEAQGLRPDQVVAAYAELGGRLPE
jgi:hypothetical protein